MESDDSNDPCRRLTFAAKRDIHRPAVSGGLELCVAAEYSERSTKQWCV
jgi:hypothetical protein